MRKYNVLLVLIAALTVIANSQDSDQLQAWNLFNDVSGDKWSIRWHDELQTPASILGHKTPPSDRMVDGVESVATNFLKEHRSIFKMRSKDDSFVLRKRNDRGNFHHLLLTQTYRGIPILGGQYNMSLDVTGSIHSIIGRSYPDIELDVMPKISMDQANQIALAPLKVQRLREPQKPELVITHHESNYRLAYRIITRAWDPLGDWSTLVDAKTGSILMTENTTRTANGSGDVYLHTPDPEHGGTTTVSLGRITSPVYLQGTYADVLNEDASRAADPDLLFFYSPTSTHFDEVNVYYHLTEYSNHMAHNLNFDLSTPITATVHYGANLNNAYSLGSNTLAFGDGDGVLFYDFAKQNDVIYHEYFHAAAEEIGLAYNNYPKEAGAMNEGYSDYFAASYTNDPDIGEWLAVSSETGLLRTTSTNPNDWNYDNIASVEYSWDWIRDLPFYPIDHDNHVIGMIWSGALWDLRNAIGNTIIADNIILEGLHRANGDVTFEDGRDGLIAADLAKYGGAHKYLIEHTMYLRGIGPDGIPPLSVSMSGPSNVYHPGKYEPDNCYSWTAVKSGGIPNYTYTWKKDGQVVQSGSSSSYQECFAWNGYGGGSYQYVLRAEVTDGASQFASADKTITASNSGGEARTVPDEIKKQTPQMYFVEQNYPNPFNPETEITFGLPEASRVKITVLDLLGREVIQLTNGSYSAGIRRISWYGVDASGQKVGSGIYFYRITAIGQNGRQFAKLMKMILTR